MRLASVNVARPEPIGANGDLTGIFKRPADGPVAVGALGLAGDTIINEDVHGGIDQAVYVYGADDYAWWSQELGREIGPGTFGENLTIDGLASDGIAIGDRLVIGPVELEVTSPRVPCATLAARMEDPKFVKAFASADRPGAYCRVLVEGSVEAGMEVAHAPYAGERVSVVEGFRRELFRDWDVATIARFLAVPIDDELRAYLEARAAQA